MPTWEDDGWETEGWSKPRRVTPEEHAKLAKAFDENGKPRVRVFGRPRKSPEEKQKPVPFNLSERLLEGFRQRAKAQGFTNWQEWLRTLGAKEAGLISVSSTKKKSHFGSAKGGVSFTDEPLLAPEDSSDWNVVRECEEK